jgi:hypothetical protein
LIYVGVRDFYSLPYSSFYPWHFIHRSVAFGGAAFFFFLLASAELLSTPSSS